MSEHVDSDLENHYNKEEMSEIVSNCCGVGCLGESTICSECLEYCERVTLGYFLLTEYENAECDKADAKIELERENES